ncbi:MAG TPA: valine--tRNA ligase [Anaerolineales bacterium]|nr:valine--tRNA ligase [Anaerolineales bacterium]
MALSRRYDPHEAEPRLQAYWRDSKVYDFSSQADRPIYSIDTPPPTVSGRLHLGHLYSYTQTDVMARYWRMRGFNVFYPMGYDDNGLPTERFVEKQLGIRAAQIRRREFIEKCGQISREFESDYESIWQRLGLSIDWRYTYRTINADSRRISQLSFLDLYHKNLVYRRRAPTIWCPECQTGIAQAELNDLERESQFVTLDFRLEDGQSLPIATTRPELLPACVAIFVHPDDKRFRGLIGHRASVPLLNQQVPVLGDRAVDPEKGTGVVMCCTFGDTTDKEWWFTYELPLVEAIARDGSMTTAAGQYAGASVSEARKRIIDDLEASGLVLDRQQTIQSVRVHERCDTPVEYIMTQQWFIRVLEYKDELLEAGEHLNWYPEHMRSRYRSWVENLAWDWCISRQRTYGVPFPLWYCQACGEIALAEEKHLPVDPSVDRPTRPCHCGSSDFTPEEDVLDTWATSSMSPQIVGQWPEGSRDAEEQLYEKVFPFSLRPQAHDIIRTWAFYTIAKSHFHFNQLPWKDVAISGWGIAGEGMGKISKSRGGGPMPPLEAIERYSADAIRYWAASTGLGKDAVIHEGKFESGARLVTKLWNVARFSERFLEGYKALEVPSGGIELIQAEMLSSADRWILSRLQRLIRRATELLENYDYAAARSEIEVFFWSELADNYLEMCKQRLYNEAAAQREGARFTLYHCLRTTLLLLAPFLPFVTEEIYLGLFTEKEEVLSVHISPWPVANKSLEDDLADTTGEALIKVATAVRRYKSERSLRLSTNLHRLELVVPTPRLKAALKGAQADLMSVARAEQVEIVDSLDPELEAIEVDGDIRMAIAPAD